MLDLKEQIDIRRQSVSNLIEQAEPQTQKSILEFFEIFAKEDFFDKESPFWPSFKLAIDALTTHYLRGGYFTLHRRARALALTAHELLDNWWPSLPSSADFSLPRRLTEWREHERFLDNIQVWRKWYGQLYLQPLKDMRAIMFTDYIARHKRLLLRPYYSLANDLVNFATYDRNPMVEAVNNWIFFLADESPKVDIEERGSIHD